MHFRMLALAWGLAVAALVFAPGAAPVAQSRAVSVTIDDLPTVSAVRRDLAEAQRITHELTAALRRSSVPAIGFVNEGKLRTDGKVDPARVALLQIWLDAGLELGNHTFAHLDLHTSAVEDFERQILEGERVTRTLLKKAGTVPQYFRHPFLHTGRDEATRARIDRFLGAHGYRVAPVTIDNYDYLFAAAYDRAVGHNDAALTERVVTEYLDYMTGVVAYCEQQSVAIVGREIAQTLLLHANAMNAATFDRLAAMFRSRGYRFINLTEALKDPAYVSRDAYYGPAGMTWLHRWALTQGVKSSVFAGEPTVPAWVEGKLPDQER
jgi:peptidoglycan/xylan/chitin deacetylase (PgdA/CDA1 family)